MGIQNYAQRYGASLTLSGVLGLAAGTALLPSLAQSADLNTGIWFPAADTISVSTGGVERLRVSSTGMVGIGSSQSNYGFLAVRGGLAGTGTSSASFITPGLANSEIASLSLFGTFAISADYDPRRTADITAGFAAGAWGTEYLAIHVGSNGGANDARTVTSEKVRILGSGYVGIGTASPTEMLHVNGVARATAFIAYNLYTDASNYERAVFDWSTNTNWLTIGTANAGTGSARNLVLAPQAGATGSIVAWGGATSSFPSLQRETTWLRAVLADGSAFTNIQGKLTTENAYVAGDPATTGYVIIYDSTGTAYKIPALAA